MQEIAKDGRKGDSVPDLAAAFVVAAAAAAAAAGAARQVAARTMTSVPEAAAAVRTGIGEAAPMSSECAPSRPSHASHARRVSHSRPDRSVKLVGSLPWRIR